VTEKICNERGKGKSKDHVPEEGGVGWSKGKGCRRTVGLGKKDRIGESWVRGLSRTAVDAMGGPKTGQSRKTHEAGESSRPATVQRKEKKVKRPKSPLEIVHVGGAGMMQGHQKKAESKNGEDGSPGDQTNWAPCQKGLISQRGKGIGGPTKESYRETTPD